MRVRSVKEGTNFSPVWAVLIFFHARGVAQHLSGQHTHSGPVFEQGYLKLFYMLQYMFYRAENIEVGLRNRGSLHVCLRLALGVTYLDGMRTIDLHDLTNVPMIKTRMTALAVKTFRSLETHSVSRIWCWIMRSFKNDQALIQFWINCWLQSRLTLKHGWRLTDNGWAPVPT